MTLGIYARKLRSKRAADRTPVGPVGHQRAPAAIATA
jgi:hypothetical protein